MNKWNEEKTKKLQKTMSVISNVLFGAGAVIGLYVLVKTVMLYQSLPPGVCPIDANRTWMYISVALLILSILFSFFEPKKEKKKKKGDAL
jgi:hypothetical protein